MGLFKGFQKTGNYAITIKPTQMFNGFPSSTFADFFPQGNFITDTSLQEWWSSDFGITLATGVSSWIGHIAGYDLAQATGAAQPTYNTADPLWNNYPSLTFDGSNDVLNAGDVLDVGTNTGWTVMVVGTYLSGTTAVIVGKSGNTSAVLGDYTVNNLSGTTRFLWGDGSIRSASGGTITSTSRMVQAGILDRAIGTVYNYLNNGLPATGACTVSSANANITAGFQVGMFAAVFYNVKVLEVLVYNRALSASEIGINYNFFKAKYNL